MGKTPSLMFIWPGLPQLYRRGSWRALGLAVGFAVLVNLALFSTLWWNELTSATVRTFLWILVVGVWGVAILATRPDRRLAERDTRDTTEDRYSAAVEHYLQGNWYLAESALIALLRRDPRDIEAALLLATMLRRTGRLDEAETRLGELTRLEESGRWAMEIQRERDLLARARTERNEKLSESAESSDHEAEDSAA